MKKGSIGNVVEAKTKAKAEAGESVQSVSQSVLSATSGQQSISSLNFNISTGFPHDPEKV